MKRARWPCLAVALLSAQTINADTTVQRSVDQGIAVEFRTEGDLRPSEAVEFSFELRDTASGAAITGLRPAAWLARRGSDAPPLNCPRQVATYLGGDLFNRAEIDLNSYFVLTLNQQASISVVDPLFGFGGSKLLAQMPLPGPGADWVLASERERIFVSIPSANQLTVADARRWKIEANLELGPNPGRLQLQAGRVWVADDLGLTAVDVDTLELVRLPIGPVVDIASSSDGDLLFAAGDHQVVIVDAHSARVLKRVPIDGSPTALAYSAAAKAAYAMDSALGRLYVIDPQRPDESVVISVDAGASQLRFAPNGRHALLPNPTLDRIQVLDAASNRIVQNLPISAGPDQISYSGLLAYVRRRDSEIVLMLSLDQLGVPGGDVGIADFPGGQHPLGAGGLADAIVPAPEGLSVLVANTDDRMVYLYKEGMAAPAGGFNTYGQAPTAVLVADYGLRERARGRYATTVPIEHSGSYQVVMFVDAPRVVACFELDIAADPDAVSAPTALVRALKPPAGLLAGEPASLRFSLSQNGAQVADGVDDVQALVFRAPGVWQQRSELSQLADGSHELRFIPPDPGTYYVWIESAQLGLARNNNQFQIYQVN